MPLARLVALHLDKPAAEIAVILNTPSIEESDSQPWTSAGLALAFGPTAIGQIDEVLKATPGYDWVRILLGGKGIDFSSEVTQTALEGLRGTLGATTDALKQIGRWTVTPWQKEQNDRNAANVTEEEIAPILADLIQRQEAGAYWSRVLAVVNPMIDAGNSAAEIKAAAIEVT